MMKTQISAIGTSVPKNQIKQSELTSKISDLMSLDSKESRILNAMLRFSGIHHRHSVLEDFTLAGSNQFYKKDNSPNTADRMSVYCNEASKLAIKAVENCVENFKKSTNENFDFSKITDLIIVSCTGLYSPGIEHSIIKHFKLNQSVNKLLIQFMGCCAAFNGLKTADSICKNNPMRKALVVCIELSTIHFQYEKTDDNLRANVLFSDGASCALIENTESTNLKSRSLKCKDFNSLYVHEASDDMAWKVTNNGFEMTLSEDIPDLLNSNMDNFVNLFNNINSTDYQLAIHPGGTKILKVLEEYFNIQPNDIRFSYDVLKNYGNMSSATILFVLKELLYSKDTISENIFACAFGPGLTFEGATFNLN